MRLPLSAALVLAAYVAAITAFGTWLGRRRRSVADYFLGGRNVPWWAIAACIVATETSTLSFIGVPAGAYAGNMTFLQLAFGYVVGRVLVSVLFLPAYFRGELFTLHATPEAHALQVLAAVQKQFGISLPGREAAHVRAQPVGQSEDKPDQDIYKIWRKVGLDQKSGAPMDGTRWLSRFASCSLI